MEYIFKHNESIRFEEKNGYIFEYDKYNRNTFYLTPNNYWCLNFFYKPINKYINMIPYQSIHKYWNLYNNLN